MEVKRASAFAPAPRLAVGQARIPILRVNCGKSGSGERFSLRFRLNFNVRSFSSINKVEIFGIKIGYQALWSPKKMLADSLVTIGPQAFFIGSGRQLFYAYPSIPVILVSPGNRIHGSEMSLCLCPFPQNPDSLGELREIGIWGTLQFEIPIKL